MRTFALWTTAATAVAAGSLACANEQGSHTVDPSPQVYVFDPAGRIRLFIDPNEAAA